MESYQNSRTLSTYILIHRNDRTVAWRNGIHKATVVDLTPLKRRLSLRIKKRKVTTP